MTIYLSTTLAELLDALDMRAPDLAAPIRERVTDLEDECDQLRQELDGQAETCASCEELEDDVNVLEAALADSRKRCAALIAAQEKTP